MVTLFWRLAPYVIAMGGFPICSYYGRGCSAPVGVFFFRRCDIVRTRQTVDADGKFLCQFFFSFFGLDIVGGELFFKKN